MFWSSLFKNGFFTSSKSSIMRFLSMTFESEVLSFEISLFAVVRLIGLSKSDKWMTSGAMILGLVV